MKESMDIKIIKNFVDKEDADRLIKYIETNKLNKDKFIYTEYLKTVESQQAQSQIPEQFSINDHPEVKDIYIKYAKRFIEECKVFFDNTEGIGLYAQWLTMYGSGNELPRHRDNHFGAEEINFSAVIYLNDDFTGGELLLEDFGYLHKPEALSMIIFHPTYWHEIKPILSGKRYAMPIWGTLNDSKKLDFIND